MTIVIDVGAARYGGDYSIERLIEQFEPTELHAIDPNPALNDSVPEDTKGTMVHLVHAAAWIHGGLVGYRADGLNSWLTNDPSAPQVACVDLARVINGIALEREESIVLKLDCEGSEYELLDWLIATNVDELLDVCIVEWHPKSEPAHEALSADIAARIRCELREWPY